MTDLRNDSAQQPETSDAPQPEEQLPEEMTKPTPRYVPRPRWQIALAWVLLIVMLFAVGFYYYWIAYRYV